MATFFEGPLGVDPFLVDGLQDAAVEHLVLEQHHVGFEDVGVRPEFIGGVLDDGAQFIHGALDRRLEPVFLVAQVGAADGVPLHDIDAFLVDDVGLSDADARRGTDPVKTNFLLFFRIRHVIRFVVRRTRSRPGPRCR